MFESIARFCLARRWWIISAYAVLLPLAVVAGRTVFPLLKAGGFEDRAAESWSVKEDLEHQLGVGSGDVIAIYTVPSGTIDDVEALGAVLPVVTRVEQEPGVVSVVSFYQTGAAQLVNADRTKTFLAITMEGDDQQKLETYRRIAPLLDAPPLTLELGGLVPVTTTLQETIVEDLKRAELLAFPITALLLLIIFGSAASASLPLLLGGVSIALALGTLRLLVEVGDVSLFAVNIISVLGSGSPSTTRSSW